MKSAADSVFSATSRRFQSSRRFRRIRVTGNRPRLNSPPTIVGPLGYRERLIEIGDDIVDMLDTD